jgi:ubiquinone/menaquinone biosynthesis C-methylase UbiE
LVGPGGFALGVDLSSAMLARARQSASSKGLDYISFENVDSQTYPFEHLYFDLVISQFGLMFFADPIAAFSNVKSGLRPGCRIAFLSWQPASEVSASRFL